MKKFLLLVILFLTSYFLHPTSLSAQGSCSCFVNVRQQCEVRYPIQCANGYEAKCNTNPTQCNLLSSSCTCTRIDPLANIFCGGNNQICCGGNPQTNANGVCDSSDFICFKPSFMSNFYCLTQAQIDALPGGGGTISQGSVFCDSSNQPSDAPSDHIYTALGCLPVSAIALTTSLLTWITGIAGSLAFLIFVYAAFLIVTSTGNIKRVQAGRELLFSAITAIILITLAVVTLNFLGLNVLGLGNLGFNV